MLDKGANIHLPDNNGETPLLVAVSSPHCNLGLATPLLALGAAIDHRDNRGMTPLYDALQRIKEENWEFVYRMVQTAKQNQIGSLSHVKQVLLEYDATRATSNSNYPPHGGPRKRFFLDMSSTKNQYASRSIKRCRNDSIEVDHYDEED